MWVCSKSNFRAGKFQKVFRQLLWNITVMIVKMVPNDIRFNEIPENWRSTIEMKLCRVVVYLHGNSTFLPDTMNVPCEESAAFALASRIHWSKIQIRTRVLRSQIQCNARVYHLNFGFLFCNGTNGTSLSSLSLSNRLDLFGNNFVIGFGVCAERQSFKISK